VEIGIPVMGHVGLLPQSVHQLGGFRKQGTEPDDADGIVMDAHALQDAGAFAVVLESIPADLARSITSQLDIPTIGIGAGPDCDGQVLVSADMLGLTQGHVPSFVKQYAQLGEGIVEAASRYVDEVRAGRFPEVKVVNAGASSQSLK
jgi:3-methyl-2-oxobutanoate hydroxymethyltransferase